MSFWDFYTHDFLCYSAILTTRILCVQPLAYNSTENGKDKDPVEVSVRVGRTKHLHKELTEQVTADV